MTVGRRVALVVLWVLSVVGAAAWTRADRQGAAPPQTFSGDDLGFRAVMHRGKMPIGSLVVKVDGQWVEVQFAGRVVPARE